MADPKPVAENAFYRGAHSPAPVELPSYDTLYPVSQGRIKSLNKLTPFYLGSSGINGYKGAAKSIAPTWAFDCEIAITKWEPYHKARNNLFAIETNNSIRIHESIRRIGLDQSIYPYDYLKILLDGQSVYPNKNKEIQGDGIGFRDDNIQAYTDSGIKSWHVFSVSPPILFEAVNEEEPIGTFMFGVSRPKFTAGQFSITFEEDSYGSIENLIYCLRRCAVDFRGRTFGPILSAPIDIRLLTGAGHRSYMDGNKGDAKGMNVSESKIFVGCSLVGAEAVTYDNDSDSFAKYNLTFNFRDICMLTGLNEGDYTKILNGNDDLLPFSAAHEYDYIEVPGKPNQNSGVGRKYKTARMADPNGNITIETALEARQFAKFRQNL